jgi:hypothetical protein
MQSTIGVNPRDRVSEAQRVAGRADRLHPPTQRGKTQRDSRGKRPPRRAYNERRRRIGEGKVRPPSHRYNHRPPNDINDLGLFGFPNIRFHKLCSIVHKLQWR